VTFSNVEPTSITEYVWPTLTNLGGSANETEVAKASITMLFMILMEECDWLQIVFRKFEMPLAKTGAWFCACCT
jgi:hypothetical protein